MDLFCIISKMPGNTCSVISCKKRTIDYPNLKMHRFPHKDANRLEKWITNCGNVALLNLEPDKLKNRFICDEHFSDNFFIDSIGRCKLTEDAIPNFYDQKLDPTKSPIEIIRKNNLKIMVRTCAVFGCTNRTNRDKNKKFFGFPGVRDNRGRDVPEGIIRRELWIKAINRSDFTNENCRYASVCCDHFLTGRPAPSGDTLNPDYVPTQNLGYESSTRITGGALGRYQRAKRRLISETEGVQSQGKRVQYETVSNVLEETNVKSEILQPECVWLEDEVNEASNTVPIKSEIDIDSHDLIKSEPIENTDADEIFTLDHPAEGQLCQNIKSENVICKNCDNSQSGEVIVSKPPAMLQKGRTLFEGIYDGLITIQLPNRSWAFQICELPARSVLFSAAGNRGKPNDDAPYYRKQIVFNENLMWKVYFYDKLHSCVQLSENLTLTELEQFLVDISKVQLCKGGPCDSLYTASQCAYVDCSGVWRHNNCPKRITKGRVCDQCATLEDTFYQLP